MCIRRVQDVYIVNLMMSLLHILKKRKAQENIMSKNLNPRRYCETMFGNIGLDVAIFNY